TGSNPVSPTREVPIEKAFPLVGSAFLVFCGVVVVLVGVGLAWDGSASREKIFSQISPRGRQLSSED
ncbi:MAG TPA: hypothetical protein VIU15_16310, partial [Streptomyces sp.]